jgi:hypothetical protein
MMNSFGIHIGKVIPVEGHSEFLKGFYNNPETGFQERDQIFAKIAQEYVGVSCTDIANWLKNLEAHQIHREAVDVKISRLCKEGMWAIDCALNSCPCPPQTFPRNVIKHAASTPHGHHYYAWLHRIEIGRPQPPYIVVEGGTGFKAGNKTFGRILECKVDFCSCRLGSPYASS